MKFFDVLSRLNDADRDKSAVVALTENNRDVDTFYKAGADVAFLPENDKAQCMAIRAALRQRDVMVISRNDEAGRFAREANAAYIHDVAASVRVLDLKQAWPELPHMGDFTSLKKQFGGNAFTMVADLYKAAPDWEPPKAREQGHKNSGKEGVWQLFKTLDKFEEEEAKWLIPGWVPEGQITLLCADGGVGKTTLWGHMIAALSSGSTCMLDPPGYTREPSKVVFITTEDSVKKKLRKKLREAGANMENIITPDFAADTSGLLRDLKFGSPLMSDAIKRFRSAACIFDPVQGFIPPEINMGSRNAMRDCMAPLLPLGEESGTAFIVICHTNKRKGAYGRDRIADSADLWDIARSVIMAGYTDEQGVRYLSNEKNNYTQLQETLLFSITDNGQIEKVGTSWKRDKEYMQDAIMAKSAPKREDCKAFITKTLAEAGGSMPTKDLDNKATEAGYSFSSIKRAKQGLKSEGAVKYYQTGSTRTGDNTWFMKIVPLALFTDLPPGTPTPFDDNPVREREVVYRNNKAVAHGHTHRLKQPGNAASRYPDTQ